MTSTSPGPKLRRSGANFGAKWPWRQAARLRRAASWVSERGPPHSRASSQWSSAPSPRLPGLLHDFQNSPALFLGDRARLGDADQVAHAALVLLVVDLELGALLHRLAV